MSSRSDDIRARIAFIHDQKDVFAQNMKYHLNCLRKETRHTQKEGNTVAVMKETILQERFVTLKQLIWSACYQMMVST